MSAQKKGARRAFVDFQEVKQKVSLPEVFQLLGIELTETRPNHWQGQCPLPSHEHKSPIPNREQFKVDLVDNTDGKISLWKCWGDCQSGGDVIEFVKRYFNFSDSHARLWFIEHWSDRLTLERPRQVTRKQDQGAAAREEKTIEEGLAKSEVSQQRTPPAAPPATPEAPTPPQPLTPLRFYLNLDASAAREYLETRKVTADTAARFGLGLARKGLMTGYLAMPLWWHDGKEWQRVAYLGRWPGDDHEPRYQLPKDFPKSRILFGLKEALEDSENVNTLIVVEGPFGLFAVRQAGFPQVVACLGSSLSDAQAELLLQTRRSIILMFDHDEAGAAGMRLAAAKVITRGFVRVVKLPQDTQPDTLLPDSLRKLLSFLP